MKGENENLNFYLKVQTLLKIVESGKCIDQNFSEHNHHLFPFLVHPEAEQRWLGFPARRLRILPSGVVSDTGKGDFRSVGPDLWLASANLCIG